MESIKTVAMLSINGCTDCIVGGVLALKFFWCTRNNSKKASQTKTTRHEGARRTIFEVLMQCLVFGAMYWLAIFVFYNYFLQHYIKYLASYLTPDEEYYYGLIVGTLSFMFYLIWIIPLFILSRFLTYSWYQEVADLTYEKTGLKATNQPSVSYSIGDMIINALTQCFFLLQGYLVSKLAVPFGIGDVLYIWHLSLLYALYAFEYKWVQKGFDINWRLAYVDSKWPYFVGFGFPLAILTYFVGSYIESICIFSILFPFYVMSSTITGGSQLKTFNRPLRVFKMSLYASDLLVSFFQKIWKIRR